MSTRRSAKKGCLAATEDKNHFKVTPLCHLSSSQNACLFYQQPSKWHFLPCSTQNLWRRSWWAKTRWTLMSMLVAWLTMSWLSKSRLLSLQNSKHLKVLDFSLISKNTWSTWLPWPNKKGRPFVMTRNAGSIATVWHSAFWKFLMSCVQPSAKRVGIWKCQHRQCYMKHAPSLSLMFVCTCVSLLVRKPTQTFFLQSADLWNLNNLACSCALFQSRLRHHHEIQFGPWCASLQHKNSSTTAWRCANFQWRGLRCCLLTNGTTVTKILHPLSWRKTRPEQFAHGFMQQEHASKEQKTRKRQTKCTKALNNSKTQNDGGHSDSIHWSMGLVIRS